MRILVAHREPGAGLAWQRALAARLPRARIDLDPGTPDGAGAASRDPAPGSDAEWAVGWGPPAGLFERHTQLRAFFSTGAGVDHLLQHPGLPPSLALVRLEDSRTAS